MWQSIGGVVVRVHRPLIGLLILWSIFDARFIAWVLRVDIAADRRFVAINRIVRGLVIGAHRRIDLHQKHLEWQVAIDEKGRLGISIVAGHDGAGIEHTALFTKHTRVFHFKIVIILVTLGYA